VIIALLFTSAMKVSWRDFITQANYTRQATILRLWPVNSDLAAWKYVDGTLLVILAVHTISQNNNYFQLLPRLFNVAHRLRFGG